MARRGSRERTLKILAAIPVEIKKAVRIEIEKQAAAIVEMQKRLAPHKDGKLRDSIRYEMGSVSLASSANLAGTSGSKTKGSRFGGSAGGKIEGDPDLTATIIAGDREAFYARFVEFGTAPHSLAKGDLVDDYVTVTRKGTTFRMKVRRRTRFNVIDHPGAAPHPFFYGPFRANKKKAKTAISRAVGKAVRAAVSKA